MEKKYNVLIGEKAHYLAKKKILDLKPSITLRKYVEDLILKDN